MHRRGELRWSDVLVYILAQVVGVFAGVAAAAHVMFEAPLFFASRHVRAGGAQMFSEFVATFGLLAVIWGCARLRAPAVPFAVAAYITAAYWFTSSTSFANPAVTMARAATDTFAGIRPADVFGFIVAQIGGTGIAILFLGWLRKPSGLVEEIDSEKESMKMKKRILFLCTGNSARSQMAEGMVRHLAGKEYDVFSAGTNPKGLHPLSIAVMKEIGIDVSQQKSKDVKVFLGQKFDYVITVCDRAKQHCPVFPG